MIAFCGTKAAHFRRLPAAGTGSCSVLHQQHPAQAAPSRAGLSPALSGARSLPAPPLPLGTGDACWLCVLEGRPCAKDTLEMVVWFFSFSWLVLW